MLIPVALKPPTYRFRNGRIHAHVCTSAALRAEERSLRAVNRALIELTFAEVSSTDPILTVSITGYAVC